MYTEDVHFLNLEMVKIGPVSESSYSTCISDLTYNIMDTLNGLLINNNLLITNKLYVALLLELLSII